MMRRVGLVLFCAFCFGSVFGQGLEREWVRTYALDKGRTNQAQFIALAPDGGVVVAGSSVNANGDSDYLVIKYSPNGDEVWKQRYDSAVGVNEQVRGLAIDPAGNVFVTGTSETVKFTAAGGFVWAVPLGGRAVVANSEFVYVVGFSEVDIVTAQLENNNTDGKELWRRTENGVTGEADIAHAVTLDSVGNVYVAGQEDFGGCSRAGCHRVFALVSYNPQGTRRFYGRGNITHPAGATPVRSLVIGPDDRIYVYGQYSLTAMLSVFDFAGNNLKNRWNTIDEASRMAVNQANGDVYITGQSYTPGTVRRAIVIRFRGDDWVMATYTGLNGGWTEGSDVALDSHGNAFVTGFSLRTAADNDLFLWKVNDMGQTLGVDRYDSPHHGSDFGTAMVIDSNDNIYVTGYSTTAEGGSEVVTIKYSTAPKIEKQASGAMHLEFYTTPGQKYALEATSDFFGWESLITNTADVNGVVRFEDTSAVTIPYRFYRGKTAE